MEIRENLCNGCGNCITECSDGALKLVGGKAKLVKENFCDGFGDCIGACPTGALTIEEREAGEFNEAAVKAHLLETQGQEAVWRMEEAQKKHQSSEKEKIMHHGCPDAQMGVLDEAGAKKPAASSINVQVIPSELRQWPVQIHLVQAGMPIFKNKELVVMSTCGPIASADVHWRYLRGRSVVVGCPKLDDTRNYGSRLGAILQEPTIPKVIVPRMEVPCCGGLTMIVQEAVKSSRRYDISIQEDIISIDGTIKASRVF